MSSLSKNPTSHLIILLVIAQPNLDLKLYTKLLASHLAKFIPSLMHPDQVVFIPNRKVSDGTRRFIDLIQWTEHYRTPSLPNSLDAEQMFDNVHWKYIKAVLVKFVITGTCL